MVMRKLCSLIECLACSVLIAAGGRSTLRAQVSSTTADSTRQATAWAEEAVQQARSGKTEDALALFRKAVPLAPNNVPVLRDYAVVLGWGEHYKEAAQVIHQNSLIGRYANMPAAICSVATRKARSTS